MNNAYAYPLVKEKDFGRDYNRYLILTGQKSYVIPQDVRPQYAAKEPSIEAILEQDAHALLDKVVTAAFSIVYRIQIYNDIKRTWDYNWLRTRNELLDLESSFYRGRNMNIERKKSMLAKELMNIERLRLEERVNVWKDLAEPVNNFVNFFHQGRELKQERSFLG
jgi:hypothetical protein